MFYLDVIYCFAKSADSFLKLDCKYLHKHRHNHHRVHLPFDLGFHGSSIRGDNTLESNHTSARCVLCVSCRGGRGAAWYSYSGAIVAWLVLLDQELTGFGGTAYP